MQIKQLGYLGLNARQPEAFAEYATTFLGLQPVAGGAGASQFRLDDRHQRITVEQAEVDGSAYCGWELDDAAAFAGALDELSDAGVQVHEATLRELEIRRVARMAHFQDPAGNRVEIFYDAASGAGAFTPSRDMSGFITGEMGLGHVVLAGPDVQALEDFYVNTLGFKVSDTMSRPFKASFLHTNARHHSVAFVDGPFFGIQEPFMHHFMLQVTSIEDVGRAYDLAQDTDVPIAMTLGQHTNDRMVSFYATSPVGVHTEFGYGGVLVDDATWQVTEIPGPDLWGHRH
jgi:3,4-dihydroxy-9,10-secoandrosta-1,3,5(10)-triene-9,17-dione 4,5-dioxygenase